VGVLLVGVGFLDTDAAGKGELLTGPVLAGAAFAFELADPGDWSVTAGIRKAQANKLLPIVPSSNRFQVFRSGISTVQTWWMFVIATATKTAPAIISDAWAVTIVS
jgi:hypothetical protein